MAVSFKIPKSPTKQVYETTNFLGADFTSEASTVDDTKSPNCENMIRSVPGKIRKRMGYEEVADYGLPIYGVHYYSVRNTYYVHAGDELYDFDGMLAGAWVDSKWNGIDDTGYDQNYKFWVSDEQITATIDTTTLEEGEYYYIGDYKVPTEAVIYRVFEPMFTEQPPVYDNYRRFRISIDSIRTALTETSATYKARKKAEYEKYDNVVDYDLSHIILLGGKNVSINLVYSQMAEHRSTSFELNGKLIILDGTSVKVVNADGSVQLLSEIAYIPEFTISRDPDGGGTQKEPLNLLQPAFIDSFYVAQSSENPDYNPSTIKDFQLSFGDLDDTTIKAWVMNSQGEFVEKTEDTHFTVDRITGVLTFGTAPGSSPIAGTDNVRVQAYKTFDGYADRINHCTIGALFGVNGAHDRIFVSGNPDSGIKDGEPYTLINCDWFSGQYDPTYFADVNYSKLGADNSAIMGYSIINNYLAAHKDTRELTQSILIREGDLVDDQPVFKLINTLQGAGAISKYCFSYLETEPVFLTELGIYAVTAQDVTGEKYAQNRSYYLEGKMLKEKGLENAIGFCWKDYYMVAINDHLYVLDGLQPMQTDRAKPYATRQYAGFYFTNIPASCFFDRNGELYFGSPDGKIYRFYSDDKDIHSYNDNGEPISCVWETADISEKLFYKKKTYRYVAVRCLPEIQSSIKTSVQKQGIWNLVKEDKTNLKYFSYANLQYSKMTYSTNRTQRISASKMRVKKLDHLRFKFENDVLNEPLGINDFAVEYTQAGNIK